MSWQVCLLFLTFLFNMRTTQIIKKKFSEFHWILFDLRVVWQRIFYNSNKVHSCKRSDKKTIKFPMTHIKSFQKMYTLKIYRYVIDNNIYDYFKSIKKQN